MGAKACCELGQLALIEDAAGVGVGLVDAGEGDGLESCVVLHGYFLRF